MPYPKCKVYSDGNHYIAIPHTTRPYRPRRKPKEEIITVTKVFADEIKKETEEQCQSEQSAPSYEDAPMPREDEQNDGAENKIASMEAPSPTRQEYSMTKKELFDQLYAEHRKLPKYKLKAFLLRSMLPYFQSEEQARVYVETNYCRKQRNLIARRVRMVRKANLQTFNYFVTFTYDSKKHTEESFKKGLRSCLSTFAKRRGWKYMGVWERSPQKQRLHFHGIFYIPNDTLPGELLPFKDYSTTSHSMQITWQSLYFNERFGRSDFKELEDPSLMGLAMAYLMKYIGKSGEKIVYSKGLPQYFISDIMDDDIICRIGVEDKKLLLTDTFACWNEGEYIGPVSKETIAQMPKSN